MRTKGESGRLIALIEGLTRGQSVIYFKGMTGWMFGSMREYGEFIAWMDNAWADGKWDFTQRKVQELGGYGIYEYIATRRIKKAPVKWPKGGE
jgi:hypothetical protein